MEPIFIQYAILLFPGVISVVLLQLLNSKKKCYSNVEIIFYSFILGFLIQIILYSIILHQPLPILDFMKKDINNSEFNINLKEFIFSIFLGGYLGIIISYFRNLGFLNTFFSNYDVTYHSGFENILERILHSPSDDSFEMKKCTVILKSNGEEHTGLLVEYEYHEDHIEILLGNSEGYQYFQLKSGEFSIHFTNEQECELTQRFIDNNRIVLTSFYAFIIFLVYINIENIKNNIDYDLLYKVIVFIFIYIMVYFIRKSGNKN